MYWGGDITFSPKPFGRGAHILSGHKFFESKIKIYPCNTRLWMVLYTKIWKVCIINIFLGPLVYVCIGIFYLFISRLQWILLLTRMWRWCCHVLTYRNMWRTIPCHSTQNGLFRNPQPLANSSCTVRFNAIFIFI